MPKQKPFISVVVITHNGASTIRATLQSLTKQQYPKKRYEIIVVDDGSTDNTGQIVSKYKKVRLLRLPRNQGISAARNAGLRAYRGDIYAAFDDDCIADKNWLAEIAKAYAFGKPVVVGSKIAEQAKVRNLATRYISSRDSNVFAQTAPTHKPSPLRRLWQYLVKPRSKAHLQPGTPETASVVYGAGSTFPREVLEKVGGWREEMSGIEDRDICKRIQAAFPDRALYIMHSAKIIHSRGQTLRQYLLRPYRRGPVTLAYYRESHSVPPIFPFPFLIVGLSVLAALISTWLFIPALIVLPMILYSWWLITAVRCKQPVVLLFPYIELAEETMTIAGICRGYFRLIKQHVAKAIQGHASVVSYIISLLLIEAWGWWVLHISPSWFYTVVSTLFILLVPGYFAFLALIGPTQRALGSRELGYIVGLSLLVLMVSGLILNESFIVFGYAKPLSQLPITLSIMGVTALLSTVAHYRRQGQGCLPYVPIHISRISKIMLVIVVSALLPLLAIAGAITLNNGGTNGIALLALGGIAGLMALMVIYHRSLSPYFSVLLYSCCASILLGTSLRGWNITGHDVMQEYQVFQLTLQHAAWHMQYYADAYMACLSITILPTVIRQVTAIPDPYVFKLLFQLIFALIAPTLYAIMKPYAGRRGSLLATLLFMSFPTFFTDIMMLNRQEIALIFLVLSLQAGLDRSFGKRQKTVFILALLAGVILSHYSTSYVAAATMGVALVLAVIWRILRWSIARPVEKTLVSIYSPAIVIASLVMLLAWGSIATQTSNNLYGTLNSINTTINNALDKAAGLPTPVVIPEPSTVSHYSNTALQERSLPAKDYYSSPILSQYPLQQAPEAIAKPTSLTGDLHLPAQLLGKGYQLMRSGYALAIEGLLIIGALGMIMLRRRYRVPIQYVLLGLGSLVLIGAQVILPPPVIDYGLTRLLQQALLLLALPAVMTALWLLQLIRVPRWAAEGLLGIIIVSFFVVLSGLLPTLTGGFKPVLSLANAGFYYDSYYTHSEEVAAAQWLATEPPVGSRVYSDEFMRRKLITYGGVFAQPTLVPGAIPIDSYVVLGYSNVTQNRVAAYDSSSVVYYQTPFQFLEQNKNLMYSSTNIRIYR